MTQVSVYYLLCRFSDHPPVPVVPESQLLEIKGLESGTGKACCAWKEYYSCTYKREADISEVVMPTS
jgi:hypothetical protein